MTDTDKLKRLADEIAAYPDWMKDDILTLIAENERLKEDAERRMDLGDKGWQERNEAVALLRRARMSIPKWEGTLYSDIGVFIRSLARIDKENE